jgi:hypothetical protein
MGSAKGLPGSPDPSSVPVTRIEVLERVSSHSLSICGFRVLWPLWLPQFRTTSDPHAGRADNLGRLIGTGVRTGGVQALLAPSHQVRAAATRPEHRELQRHPRHSVRAPPGRVYTP